MFLVIGLVGMLLFAGWAVTQAYSSYVERQASEISGRYIQQGDKLLALGKTDAALDQYNNAIRSAGQTKAASAARRKLAVVYVDFARQSFLTGNYAAAAAQGLKAVEVDPDLSAGHYYAGAASYYQGDRVRAAAELKKHFRSIHDLMNASYE
jgi:tetratricopeptide (TPR) repeat protein